MQMGIEKGIYSCNKETCFWGITIYNYSDVSAMQAAQEITLAPRILNI